MNKPSMRDIQVFVGGALAILGSRTLLWIPYDFSSGASLTSYLRVFAAVFAGLTLPIGLGILFNSRPAILLAQIYLWLEVVFGLIVIALSLSLPPRLQFPPVRWNTVPELLCDMILLALLLWSGSRKFADPMNSTQNNPTL